MSQEVQDVHELQAKVGERHKKAFDQLSAQLDEAKKSLAAYSTSQIQLIQGRTTGLSQEQKSRREKVLNNLRQRVVDLTRQLEELKTESLTEILAQKQLAQTLESDITKNDEDIIDQLSEVHSQADKVEQQQSNHLAQLQAALEAQERRERLDVADVMKQQDVTLGTTAGSVQGSLESTTNFIQQAVQQGLAALDQNIAEERDAENQRWDQLNTAVSSENATTSADDESRLTKLRLLKLDFDKLSGELKQEMSSISTRLEQAQAMSSSDRSELMKTAESSNSFLLGRMDTAFADIDNATNAISETQKQKLALLQHAVSHVATGVTAFGDASDSAQLQWNAQKYNFESEAHREAADEEEKLQALIQAQLKTMQSTVGAEIQKSNEELHALEAYSETESLAVNATLSATLESLSRNATERADQLRQVMQQYLELNASRQHELVVSEHNTQALVKEIERVQQAVSKATEESSSRLSARAHAQIQDVEFNASQTLEQDEVFFEHLSICVSICLFMYLCVVAYMCLSMFLSTYTYARLTCPCICTYLCTIICIRQLHVGNQLNNVSRDRPTQHLYMCMYVLLT
jgi:hypothetical protein